ADGADHRQSLAEQDAGLAAVEIGDLADRIGDQEAAHPEQADGETGEARRAGHGDHHQRTDAVGELDAGADKRLRQRKQHGVALDQRRDGGCQARDGLVHQTFASSGWRGDEAPVPANDGRTSRANARRFSREPAGPLSSTCSTPAARSLVSFAAIASGVPYIALSAAESSVSAKVSMLDLALPLG